MAEDDNNERRMKESEPGKGPRLPRNGSLLVVLALLLLMLVSVFNLMPRQEELTYNGFLKLLQDSTARVTSLTLVPTPEGTEVHGQRLATEKEKKAQAGRARWLPPVDTIAFTVHLLDVEDSTLRSWATNKGIRVEVQKKGGAWISYFLIYILPIGAFVFLWFMMMRQGQGPRSVFSFGKSKVKVMGKDVPRVTFDDVAGCDEAKGELVEIIDFLRDPERFNRLGGKIPRGVLLMGPPGTGKTLLAKAIAGEAKVPFFSMSGASFVEMFVGVGASRVRDLFEQAKKAAPCIIFIDEIDAVGRQRGAGLGGGHDEREQTLNQLLIEMDGFSGNDGVIITAATNRPDILDPALLRPGRFDRRVVVDRPDVKGRLEILKVHTGTKIPLAPDVDLEVIARGTPGFAGADLANLANEAALLAARLGKERVEMIDFEQAKDKVFMGVERRSMVMNEHDKKVTAYHEAGHAVVALYTAGADPVHKITIIPRGRALGVTWQLPERDRYNLTLTYIEGQIAILMGGRLAEEIFLDQISTGASNDIQRATELARKMVCEFGMSPEIGPLHYGNGDHQVFLGRDIASGKEYSEETSRQIDVEVRRIVDTNYRRAREILETRRDTMKLLAEALLEFESIDEADIKELLEKGRISRPKFAPPSPQKLDREGRDNRRVAEAVTDPDMPAHPLGDRQPTAKDAGAEPPPTPPSA